MLLYTYRKGDNKKHQTKGGNNMIEIIYNDEVIDTAHDVECALLLQRAYNHLFNTDAVEIKIPLICF